MPSNAAKWSQGRVQGVGFRAATRRIAQELRLNGWVRNEPDGSVRLVAEGSTTSIAALHRRIGDKFGQFIHSHTNTISTATGEFADFEIRR